jgi:hypothetical protein
MIAEFKTEDAARNFMAFLSSHNNQGTIQVSYRWAIDGENVRYTYNNLVHSDLPKKVQHHLDQYENT